MKGQISSVKGSLLPHFSCYTLAKLIRFFQTFRIGFSTFEVAAMDMMNFESSYTFTQSQINLPFDVSLIFLEDRGETKLIPEATLKGHISSSPRGVPILRLGLELPWSQINLGSIKRLRCVHMPGVARDNGQEGRK